MRLLRQHMDVYIIFIARVFVPAWPLQPSLMFLCKVISPFQVGHLLGQATGFYRKTLDEAVKASHECIHNIYSERFHPCLAFTA